MVFSTNILHNLVLYHQVVIIVHDCIPLGMKDEDHVKVHKVSSER